MLCVSASEAGEGWSVIRASAAANATMAVTATTSTSRRTSSGRGRRPLDAGVGLVPDFAVRERNFATLGRALAVLERDFGALEPDLGVLERDFGALAMQPSSVQVTLQ
ncbi:hypothetical protein GCM10010307_87280 [Streptomyces vastus]|uniref:FXSXX-COOH protein n=1 Tax=Streptomyces vastus TaxID=285451 RepID=A0ABN3S0I0_9ACTN